MTIAVRDAAEADLAAILAIYNEEVRTGTATFDLEPRTLAQQRVWLKEHAPPYCAIVAVDGAAEVVGWGSLSVYRTKGAYRLSVEDTIYVRADRQRQGIGRALLSELMRRAREAGFHTVLGVITAENDVSIRLHEAFGFEVIGRAHEVGYKFDRWLDVVTMQRMLAD